MKIERNCLICEGKFKIEPSRIKKGYGKYCSRKCAGIGQNKKIKKDCKICGKEFITIPSKIKNGESKFCSRRCFGKWLSENMEWKKGKENYNWKGGKEKWSKGNIKRTCLTCGKKIYTIPSRIKRGCGKFCSVSCFNKWRLKNKKRGKDSPFWKERVKQMCEMCRKEFYILPSKVKKGEKRRFCSKKCRFKYCIGKNHHHWKEKIKRICQVCRKEFEVVPARIKNGWGRFCSRSCNAIWQIAHNNKKNTSIETKIERELTYRGIKFQKQYPIYQAKTIPDFFIPPNICIYCDGDYWHNLPKQKIKDRQQDFVLRFLCYKVYRFWEHEINKDVKKCVDKIQHYLSAT